jgi:hypothetical protein
MKILLLCLCLLPGLVFAQGKKALDEKYGFREMKFESDVSAYPDLVKLPVEDANGPQQLYTRPSDQLKVGDATLSAIVYEFYNGKLATVTLETVGTNNTIALQDALRAQYGPGYPALKFTDEVLWTSSKVRMYYRRNSISGDGRVRMASKEMDKQREQGAKQGAKAAKSDL